MSGEPLELSKPHDEVPKEYSEDYMYILLEATRAEFESVESQQLPQTRPSSTK